jgi:hypothetical protein
MATTAHDITRPIEAAEIPSSAFVVAACISLAVWLVLAACAYGISAAS